jgi:F-type H+-transporting ATPase subunit epsilon
MRPRTLALEIVTPDGVALREDGVDVVVLRRRERRFEAGSEIAVFPLHGPLLVRLPIAPLRYYKAGERVHLAVGGGFAEVLGDRVLVVTPRVERVAPTDQRPLATAAAICRRWRQEAVDSRERLVGYA